MVRGVRFVVQAVGWSVLVVVGCSTLVVQISEFAFRPRKVVRHVRSY